MIPYDYQFMNRYLIINAHFYLINLSNQFMNILFSVYIIYLIKLSVLITTNTLSIVQICEKNLKFIF